MFSADLGGAAPASAPAATDPPFQKVALLLHGDGTNGAQNNTFVDSSYPGGYAVSFDGTGDYLTYNPSTSLNIGSSDFTIEAWVYYTGVNNSVIYSNSGSFTFVYGVSGKLRFFTANGTNIIDASVAFISNQWVHVAAVRSSGTLKLYQNGVEVGSSSSYPSIGNSSATSYVGIYHNATAAPWVGYISNLRIVNGTALYTSNFIPSNQPLTAVSGTSLLTCQSATIVDNSPNAFTITANGNAAAVSSKTITRTGNVAQGTFSPFSLAEGQWSNYFDGSGDYLSIPISNNFVLGTGDCNIEAWIYTGSTGNQTLYDYRSGFSAEGLTFGFVGNSSAYVYAGAYSNSVPLIQGGTVPLNQWVHIAFSRASGTNNLYINGTRVATNTNVWNQTGTATTNFIGVNPYTGGVSYINGYVSNFRFVKGTAVYSGSSFTVPTSPLTAISGTSLLTCQSNRFKDNSSNNFTITRNGDTKVTAFSPFAPSAAYSASTNGGSGYFDGTGDYLTTSSTITLTGDYTLECWFYQNAKSTNYVPIIESDSGSFNFPLILDFAAGGSRGDGYIGFYLQSGTPTASTGSKVFELNTWNHVAAVRSGSNYYVYVNGTRVISTTGSVTSVSVNKIGGYSTSGYLLNGYISDARVTNTALYTGSTYTVPTAPLTAVANTQLLLNCTNAGIIDNAGKNDIETVGNAQISTSVKKYGMGSMYFDGTGDRLFMPATSELILNSSFTAEFWVNFSALPSAFILMLVGTSANTQFFISTKSNGQGIRFGLTGVAEYAAGTKTWSTGTWYHVALVRNGTNVKFYVDGVDVSDSASYSNSTSYSGALQVAGGAESGSVVVALNGYIDDLRITKGQALYTSNFTPPTQAFPNV